jgi:hypothetical protein
MVVIFLIVAIGVASFITLAYSEWRMRREQKGGGNGKA